MSELIDTTEMYLRTVYELVEEGVPPLRARIAERLRQSGPTVSQTVGRMERDGLLSVHPDRRIELTEAGWALATRVMRKHRLAERLLTDMIGLDWELVHEEACRWEHVISDQVERRLVEILRAPTASPYGNPIPALGELGGRFDDAHMGRVVTLASVLRGSGPWRVSVERISEYAQSQPDVLRAFADAGVRPGEAFEVSLGDGRLVLGPLGRSGPPCTVEQAIASHLFVTPQLG